MSLGALFEDYVAGDEPAVIDHGGGGVREYGYAEFDAACGRLAAGLRERGLGKGDRVGVLARNRVEFLEVVFGALRIGIVPVPINAKLPADGVKFIARDADLEVLFHDEEHAKALPAGLPGLALESCHRDFAGLDPLPPEALPPDAEGLLLYTSGSSGRPRGVVHSHASQRWMVETLLPPAAFRLPGQRVLVAAPLYHKNGMLSSKMALGMQAAVVLLPRFTAEGYIQAIDRHRCTSIGGVPTMFALVVRERALLAESDLSSVQRITIGSAPLTGALLEAVQRVFPNAAIVNGYGTTETGAAVFGVHPDGLPTPPLALGHAIEGIELRLVGGESDAEGELWIRSPGVMDGYLKLPDVSASRIEDGWYKTGDLMRRDSLGFYFFVGRSDDMFVCGGENVFPGEVEALLERHPEVHEAAVVAVDDSIKGQIPVAFVVRKGDTLDEEAVKKFAIQNGPAYQHPRQVFFLDALPLAGTNKVDRRLLTERAAALRPGG